MQIAIISDTHDQVGYIDRFLYYAKEKKLDLIIHCGDISTLETLWHLANKWEKEIIVTLGNADAFSFSSTWKKEIPPNVVVYEEEYVLKKDGLNLHFNHYPDVAARKAERQKFDFVFHGHTHKPWLTKVGTCYVANPGTLGGLRYDPTFAILDTEKAYLSLIRLSDIL